MYHLSVSLLQEMVLYFPNTMVPKLAVLGFFLSRNFHQSRPRTVQVRPTSYNWK